MTGIPHITVADAAALQTLNLVGSEVGWNSRLPIEVFAPPRAAAPQCPLAFNLNWPDRAQNPQLIIFGRRSLRLASVSAV